MAGTDNQPGPSSLFFETKCKNSVRCRRKPGAERVRRGKPSPFGTQTPPSNARGAPPTPCCACRKTITVYCRHWVGAGTLKLTVSNNIL